MRRRPRSSRRRRACLQAGTTYCDSGRTQAFTPAEPHDDEVMRIVIEKSAPEAESVARRLAAEGHDVRIADLDADSGAG